MVKYNYLAFALRLAKEGRLSEFMKIKAETPDTREALESLCREFGIKEIMPEDEHVRRKVGPGHIEIYGMALTLS